MTDRPFHVLFLCTGNSARSIMAEALLDKLGAQHFRGFSAGSRPIGHVHPLALRVLHRWNAESGAWRSKSWLEFAIPAAPPIDLVITVCDNAAAEVCPVWPGGPATAHWGLPDPAAVGGGESVSEQAFVAVAHALARGIEQLVRLPAHALTRAELQDRVRGLAPALAGTGQGHRDDPGTHA
jgi:arsenate reductase